MMDGRVMVMDFNKKRPIGQGAVFVGQVKARSNAFSPHVYWWRPGHAMSILEDMRLGAPIGKTHGSKTLIH